MEVTKMLNIGKELQKKLNTVGIQDAEELASLGAKEAYRRMKVPYPEVCLVHLYALQGAIDTIPYDKLPEATKADLKAFSDSLV